MQLSEVKGIGKKKLEVLNSMGIFDVNDLLNYFPYRYENRSIIKNIINIRDEESCVIKVKFISKPVTKYLRRNLNLTSAIAFDDTSKISVSWFNQPFIRNQILPNTTYYLYGKINRVQNQFKISSPILSKTFGGKLGIIYPIYKVKKGVTNNDMIKFIDFAIKHCIDEIKNVIPYSMIKNYDIENKRNAIKNIHKPEDYAQFKRARTALVLEEVIIMQLAMKSMKTTLNEQNYIKFQTDESMDIFIQSLKFELTKGQLEAIRDIESDMTSKKRMNRLVQGDVGSGKTIVAEAAIFKSYSSGYQSAFMAPTDILATQHYENLSDDFSKFGLKVCLLKSDLTKSEKDSVLEGIKSGYFDVIVGTHAIIQDFVEFKKLGLVITDEQHRFGVGQRKKISDKGQNPDVLVMTATPIPRTLALSYYGDLDISTINEMPKGRKVIETYSVGFSYEKRIAAFIRKQVENGFQAYVVCPLIEESEALDLENVTELYNRLSSEYFSDINVGMLHGKMKSAEKEEIMKDFVDGKTKILVSTTVIEVGVDVKKANVIVIYNAERFGLSQLHQLRGRVGRSSDQSYCILINNAHSDEQMERMNIMVKTNSGFELSQKDLMMRGSGDLLGTRQSGIPLLNIADLEKDYDLIEKAAVITEYIYTNDLCETKEYIYLDEEINKFKDKLLENVIFN